MRGYEAFSDVISGEEGVNAGESYYWICNVTWETLMPRGGRHRSPRGITRRRRNCLPAHLRRPRFEHAKSFQLTILILELGPTGGISVEAEETMEEERQIRF